MSSLDFEYQIPRNVEHFAGSRIGDYQILSILGEGSFGVVYKIKDKVGRIYALKLLKLWQIPSEKERKIIIQRFIREFEITKIDSDFLVQGYDYGINNGNPYFTMDFCDGGNLCRHLGVQKHIYKIAFGILNGLRELHSHGYFHRDLKPSNVLLDNSNIRLSDFGISGHTNSTLTQRNIFGNTKEIFGTWAYIAPEQENNKNSNFKSLDALADIFAFGVTMFELFTCKYPFPPFRIKDNSDLADYRKNVITGNYSGLKLYAGSLPSEWQNIISTCLQVDPEKRYQSVQQIMNVFGDENIEMNKQSFDSHKTTLHIQIVYGKDMYKLYKLDGLKNDRSCSISANGNVVYRLGRKTNDIENEIEITEENTCYISRRHATIEVSSSPKYYLLKDGQYNESEHLWITSKNGVFLNGRKVNMAGSYIKHGDLIVVGDTVMKVIAMKIDFANTSY